MSEMTPEEAAAADAHAEKVLEFLDDEDAPLKEAHGDYIEGPQEVEDGD